MQGQDALLLNGLGRDELSIGSGGRIADRCSIGRIILLATGCGFLKAVEFGCKSPWS